MKMNWKRFAEIAQMVGPMVLVTLNPALAPIAGKVTQAIVEAEAMKGHDGKPVSGAEKAAHVKNIIKLGLESANVAGAKIDIPNIDITLTDGINAVVGTVNIIEAKGRVKVLPSASPDSTDSGTTAPA